MLHMPVVGGIGQSWLLMHCFVQIIICMIRAHWLYVGSVQSMFVWHGVP
jgi:hypothetical protein